MELYNVAARALVGGAVGALSDVAMSEYKKNCVTTLNEW